MKFFNKILIGLIGLVAFYMAYTFYELKQELNKVYETDARYQHAPEGADLIVVDFSAYGCSHCRTLHPVLVEAMKKDGKIKYIPRPVTFRDPWYTKMIPAVYAAAEQGKFMEMHEKIYEKWPVLTTEQIMQAAKEIGLDTKQLSRDMRLDNVNGAVLDNQRFFEAHYLTRTPTLLIGSNAFIPGEKPPTVDDLLQKFKESR